MTNTIVWFRQDLRIDDNPALIAALRRGPIVPVFIWQPEEEGRWPPGESSRRWLRRSLTALGAELRQRDSRLHVLRGPSAEVLADMAARYEATAVFWNRRYEPASIERDASVRRYLRDRGIEASEFEGTLLFDPSTIRTQAGGPYRVFTAFWNACLRQPEPSPPADAPLSLPTVPVPAASDTPAAEEVIGAIAPSGGLDKWHPGPRGAREALDSFLSGSAVSYPDVRDRPDLQATSRLSPFLHFGEISVRAVWHALRELAATSSPASADAIHQVQRQLVWREFAYNLLLHFPKSPTVPLRANFRHFPWRKNKKTMEAWTTGRTGYPIVDAGMRELNCTGWMHNRVRMITASFVIKDLLIPWTAGAEWFWHRLVDADLAVNTLNWQWVAGCGADAAPFFRIFNPVTQGRKFDPKGDYVRRWVPELRRLPDRWIHQPWQAPNAKSALGGDYPHPIVVHADARKRALDAFSSIRGA